ncbi:MAG: S46 family peptidase, partial [Saprospiraceae bacterium]|nr:S46 family peptidase [Saprospiraceae bacterium]
DFQAAAAALFSQSVFPDQKKLEELLKMPAEKALEKITSDPAYQINQMLSGKYNEDILPPYRLFSEQVNELQRLYMQAQMEVFPKKRFYPDANSTLRVSYGKVEGFDPRDG